MRKGGEVAKKLRELHAAWFDVRLGAGPTVPNLREIAGSLVPRAVGGPGYPSG